MHFDLSFKSVPVIMFQVQCGWDPSVNVTSRSLSTRNCICCSSGLDLSDELHPLKVSPYCNLAGYLLKSNPALQVIYFFLIVNIVVYSQKAIGTVFLSVAIVFLKSWAIIALLSTSLPIDHYCKPGATALREVTACAVRLSAASSFFCKLGARANCLTWLFRITVGPANFSLWPLSHAHIWQRGKDSYMRVGLAGK